MDVERISEFVRITCPACRRVEFVPWDEVGRIFRRNVDIASRLSEGLICRCQFDQQPQSVDGNIVSLDDFRLTSG